MKIIKCLVLIGLTLVTFNGYSQISEKEEMVKKIFEVLKNKDQEGFIRLFPDLPTMRQLIGQMFEGDTSSAIKSRIEGELLGMTDSTLQKEYGRAYKQSIAKGENKGINWSAARFISYTTDTLVLKDGINSSMLKGRIYFNAAGKDYFIAFSEVIWFQNKGWYGVSIEKIDDKSNEQAYNEEEALIKDESIVRPPEVVETQDSTGATVEMKPTTPVKKQPVKNKTAKPKSTTPAKKP